MLIVPSRTDNLPTVIIEAFSIGIPVIASNSGGIPDMIEDDYNGLLFDKEDEKAMANKMISFFENPVKAKILGDNAKDFFNMHYNIETLPNRFEQLLEDVIKI